MFFFFLRTEGPKKKTFGSKKICCNQKTTFSFSCYLTHTHTHTQHGNTFRLPAAALTFGPSKHESKALIVLFLQDHRLLLNNAVTVERIPGTATIIVTRHHHRGRSSARDVHHHSQLITPARQIQAAWRKGGSEGAGGAKEEGGGYRDRRAWHNETCRVGAGRVGASLRKESYMVGRLPEVGG